MFISYFTTKSLNLAGILDTLLLFRVDLGVSTGGSLFTTAGGLVLLPAVAASAVAFGGVSGGRGGYPSGITSGTGKVGVDDGRRCFLFRRYTASPVLMMYDLGVSAILVTTAGFQRSSKLTCTWSPTCSGFSCFAVLSYNTFCFSRVFVKLVL